MEALGNPGYQLQRDAVNAHLKTYFTGHPRAVPAEPFPLQVLMSDWLLVYQSLADTKSPYELRYAVTTGGERSGFLKRKASRSVWTARRHRVLPRWKNGKPTITRWSKQPHKPTATNAQRNSPSSCRSGSLTEKLLRRPTDGPVLVAPDIRRPM